MIPWGVMTETHQWLAVALLGAACGGKADTAAPATTSTTVTTTSTTTPTTPAIACPTGMVGVEGGTFTLGEWNEADITYYEGRAIPEIELTVESFCVDVYPFPGEAGDAWPSDGLSYDQAAAFGDTITVYGRRLCTTAELLLAAAGPENWRYPYDPEDYSEGTCDPSDNTPMPLGEYPGCVSPVGVHDFMVRSSWSVFDAATLAAVEKNWSGDLPGGGTYAVYGGTSRQDTIYAPNNYAIHLYGPKDGTYTTNNVRTCADVGAGEKTTDEAWARWTDNFTGSFADFL